MCKKGKSLPFSVSLFYNRRGKVKNRLIYDSWNSTNSGLLNGDRPFSLSANQQADFDVSLH